MAHGVCAKYQYSERGEGERGGGGMDEPEHSVTWSVTSRQCMLKIPHIVAGPWIESLVVCLWNEQITVIKLLQFITLPAR